VVPQQKKRGMVRGSERFWTLRELRKFIHIWPQHKGGSGQFIYNNRAEEWVRKKKKTPREQVLAGGIFAALGGQVRKL